MKREYKIQIWSEVKSSVKLMYRMLIADEGLVTKYQEKWEKSLGKIEYSDFVKYIRNIYSTTTCTKLPAFQYRFLVHAVITNIHLKYYKIRSNDNCSFCDVHQETYRHLVYECVKNQPLWDWIRKVVKNEMRWDQIVFNNVTQNPKMKKNCLILITKHFIYRERCLGKECTIVGLKKYVRNYEQIEYQIAKQKGKISQHELKWSNMDLN